MCDMSALRKQAEEGRSVTLDPATLLGLLDAAAVIKVAIPNPKPRREPRPSSEEDERCARWMFEVLQANNPTAKAPNFSTWANEVRLMRERDERTHHEMCGLFRWAQQDSFWNANILSPKKLREKWDQLVMQRRRTAPKGPTQLGKQGQATAQNAQRWLEEHGNAA